MDNWNCIIGDSYNLKKSNYPKPTYKFLINFYLWNFSMVILNVVIMILKYIIII